MQDNLNLFTVPPEDRDAQQRERALEVTTSFVVQAPAGSGKTELLVQRFLALLAVVREPENIVAITFTRKAAGEMRTRVAQGLRDAATLPPPEEEHKRQRWKLAHSVLARDEKRGWKLLESPGRLRIVTIDSLCHGIARLMPWTSELGSVRNVSDTPDELYAAAAHRTIQLLGTANPVARDLRRALEHLDNNVGELEAELVKMLRRRDQWLRHVEVRDISQLRESMESTLRRLVCERLEAVHRMIPDELRSELVRLVQLAAKQRKLDDPDDVIASCENLDGFPDCTPEALKNWCGLINIVLTKSTADWRKAADIRIGFHRNEKEEKENLANLIGSLRAIVGLREEFASIRELPPARYSDSQWEALECFARILPVAVEQLRTVFVDRQVCDYSEIAGAALKALKKQGNPTDLALALGEGIEHLLVDEFQDTSITQVELLNALTAGWKHGDGRTLFLVGDPMQSIYRFREAEVSSFIRVSETCSFGSIGLELLRLEKNFRSRQKIVDWVNDTFPHVFLPQEDITTGAVQFAPCLSAARNKDDAATVQLYTQFGIAEDVRLDEAAQVVDVVRDVRSRGGKAAVLVRSRTHLFSIVSLLRAAAASDPQLRFQAVEIDPLSDQIVIGDLRALTHALLHLGNRVAWLAILRAPWCGLSLRDLHALVAGSKHTSVFELMRERSREISEDGQARLARISPVLESALAQRGRLPLRQWVESTWVSLNGPACLRDNRELEDAGAFFNLLDTLDVGGDVESLAQFDTAVSRLYSQPDPDATDAIQVMTIHKAKGLEFDAVLLPSLGRYVQGSGRSLLLWNEQNTEGTPELLMAAMKAKGDEDDPIYKCLKDMEEEAEVNERHRLLYVAATRAKHELHLFASMNCDPEEVLSGEKVPNKLSMLSLLWPTLEPEFRRQAERRRDKPLRLAASAEEKIERPLRRLPLDWSAPELPAGFAWRKGSEPEELRPEDGVTYDWASERARRVGVVVHEVLQRVAEEGLANWGENRVCEMRPALESALASQGVGPGDMKDALARTEQAVLASILGERGRWILQERLGARNEFSLTGMVDGELSSFVIDRTFICDGVRWIIDYKTGSREGGDPVAFLDNEKIRYQEKMERYARIFGALDPSLPIRVGLYYPLMNGWRAWEPKPSSAEQLSDKASV
jgi:ATP-dependent exoDNAse (exonuclease V) beta subunit